ncbi:cys/Met metabolism PLP-dependent enzyme domain-containing protein [Sarocladium implicatum]|nr:cys/Met metabolism PLP-dependent enzyme domain-containing protein [Sarocladium implicatum]
MLVTSLTKSFSGQANCLGGSIILNPLSPQYPLLSSKWSSSFRNELFTGDAQVLLDNSRGYIERTKAFNENARTMAEYLQDKWVGKPESPVVAVRYPPLLPTKASYDKYLRPSTPELPSPGYGCLMTIDFASEAHAAAFYDHAGFLPTTHLAAPVTLKLAYNMLCFGKKPEERAYVRQFGLREEAVRISVGWQEKPEDLIDTLEDALRTVVEVVKNGNGSVGRTVETPASQIAA